jgi:hypothetical protein
MFKLKYDLHGTSMTDPNCSGLSVGSRLLHGRFDLAKKELIDHAQQQSRCPKSTHFCPNLGHGASR